MERKEFAKVLTQFDKMKSKHPDAVLLFRAGDFYEIYKGDAYDCATLLGLNLTERAGVPLAGFPKHALDFYLPKLVRAGRRVAICEQLEKPQRGTTKRG